MTLHDKHSTPFGNPLAYFRHTCKQTQYSIFYQTEKLIAGLTVLVNQLLNDMLNKYDSFLIVCARICFLLPIHSEILIQETYPTERPQPTSAHKGRDRVTFNFLTIHNSKMSDSKVFTRQWITEEECVCIESLIKRIMVCLRGSCAYQHCCCCHSSLCSIRRELNMSFIFAALFCMALLPVPVIQLNLDGQLLQGDVGVVPEGNLHHLPDQLVQLAL